MQCKYLRPQNSALHRHVFRRRRSHSFEGPPASQLEQKASPAEPKSVRPLQAEKESVLFFVVVLLSLDPFIYLCSSAQSAVRPLPPYRVVFPDELQAMETLQARDALIVRRLAANASSQNPPRSASILDQWLVIDRFIFPDTRSSETVNASGHSPTLSLIPHILRPVKVTSIPSRRAWKRWRECYRAYVLAISARAPLTVIGSAVSGRRLLARNGARRMGP